AGLYVINESQNNYSVDYYSNSNDVQLNTELSMYLQTKKIQQVAVQNQLSAADQQALAVPVEFEKQQFTAKNEASVFVTYLMLMMILMAIMMYGTTIATGVASEKASRVMEVMVTKVNPLAMIFGKIFGIALAGLVQFIAFFGAVALYLKSGIVEPAKSLGNFELNLSALT
ncbi:ABC transporter permease, partial [Bacillus cereus]|nr:ABC transporter permease [Bacillus cereus]